MKHEKCKAGLRNTEAIIAITLVHLRNVFHDVIKRAKLYLKANKGGGHSQHLL